METVKLRVSLHEAPDEPRVLAVGAELEVAVLCQHAARTFNRFCTLDALTFTLDGERIDLKALPEGCTVGALAARDGELVIGYRRLCVFTVMPGA